MRTLLRSAAIASVALALVAAGAGDRWLPVHVGGRALRQSDGGWLFGWPGTYFEGKFMGANVAVVVDNPGDRLAVLVDGQRKALITGGGRQRIPIGGLASGEHVVRVEKLSESRSGVGGRFIGFAAPRGTKALPAPRRRLQIEFIGDSYTVGYGDLSNTPRCTDSEVHDRTDSQQGFAALTARRLGADYRLMAVSGRGVVRNYAGTNPGEPLPVLYRRALPWLSDRAPQGDAAWRPRLIVAELGTNDFSTGLKAGERWSDSAALRQDFEARYLAFLRAVIARQPQARLVLVAPDKLAAETQLLAGQLGRAAGIPLRTVSFGPISWQGCQGHPTVADHRMIAARLLDTIKGRGSS